MCSLWSIYNREICALISVYLTMNLNRPLFVDYIKGDVTCSLPKGLDKTKALAGTTSLICIQNK